MDDFGNVIKRNDNNFVIFVDLNKRYSGYNVVPRAEDPYNAYDIEEVRRYCLEKPNKVFDDYNPEPDPSKPTQLDRVEAQAVYTAMMTDTLIEE